jgi:hypothetical protein
MGLFLNGSGALSSDTDVKQRMLRPRSEVAIEFVRSYQPRAIFLAVVSCKLTRIIFRRVKWELLL